MLRRGRAALAAPRGCAPGTRADKAGVQGGTGVRRRGGSKERRGGGGAGGVRRAGARGVRAMGLVQG